MWSVGMTCSGFLDGLQRGDHIVEVVQDLPVVGGQPSVAALLGELQGVDALAPVDRQERRGRLEVGAGLMGGESSCPAS